MDLLDDIGDKLIADGLVEGATGWKLYKSYLPENDNDQCVALYELPGPEPDQTGGIKHEFPAFQVFVRANRFEYNVARTKIKAIFNSLNDADITGYTYIYASDSGPILDRYDKENRPVIFWSFRTMKTPDSTAITVGQATMGTGTNTPDVNAGATFSITIPSASMGAVGV